MVQDNLPFQLDKSDELSLWRAKTFHEKEPETLAWLDFFSNKADARMLCDVGANIGIYSLFWLSLNRGNRAIAFEPFDRNFELLQRNLRQNKYLKRCQTFPYAVADLDGVQSYTLSDNRPGSSGFALTVKGKLSEEINLIKTIRLDSLFPRLAEQMILKIDIDGADFSALKSSQGLLIKKSIVSVLIESTPEEHREIEKFLANYALFPDSRFNEMNPHSNVRRVATLKVERNVVYTRRDLIRETT
jgi:FkbM family methyltransferase